MTRNHFGDNTTLWAAVLNTLHNGLQTAVVLNGCAPSKGSGDWDTDIASGDVHVADQTGAVSSQTVTHTQPSTDSDMDSGESRIDLVTITSSGTASITEGAAASSPSSPDIPTDEVCVAVWHIENGDSTLGSADLFDPRVIHDSPSIGTPEDQIMASLGG